MAGICILTGGQPSSDPRLVKEADALAEAGHEVQVLAVAAPWSQARDAQLVARRRWSCRFVGGLPDNQRMRYYWTRLRHAAARRAPGRLAGVTPITRWATSRAVPELTVAARRVRAELYIAHGSDALFAAERATRAHNALLGYDAEDFLPGMHAPSHPVRPVERARVAAECRLMRHCSYLTAASPGIAAAYADHCHLPQPTPILNVFPLDQRPPAFRPTADDGPLTLYWFSQTIGPGRGLEDAVLALGNLRDCDVELHLQGFWAPGYRQSLFALAAEAGVDPQRIISHDPAHPDDLVSIAAGYDVGLALERRLPVNRDVCLTNKVFTSLLAGNALVMTGTQAQRALGEELGQGAFCYTPGDIDALASQIRRWHHDRGSLDVARHSSWDWGTRRFNWDREKETFLTLVDAVLSGRAPLPASGAATP